MMIAVTPTAVMAIPPSTRQRGHLCTPMEIRMYQMDHLLLNHLVIQIMPTNPPTQLPLVGLAVGDTDYLTISPTSCLASSRYV